MYYNLTQEIWEDMVETIAEQEFDGFEFTRYQKVLPGDIWNNGQVRTTIAESLKDCGADRIITGKNCENWLEFFGNIVKYSALHAKRMEDMARSEGQDIGEKKCLPGGPEINIGPIRSGFFTEDAEGVYAGFDVKIYNQKNQEIFNMGYWSKNDSDEKRQSPDFIKELGNDMLDDREHIFVITRDKHGNPDNFCFILNQDQSIDFVSANANEQADDRAQ